MIPAEGFCCFQCRELKPCFIRVNIKCTTDTASDTHFGISL